MKKLLSLMLALAMLLSVTAALAEEEDHSQWTIEHGWVLNPEENGYIKMQPDILTSATQVKQGGVNYGPIEWDAELQQAAVKEFLKGGKYLGDASFAQDETGNNYREMYQLATSYNNIPSNTNLEMVLDTKTMHLLGTSEANTGKTIEFQQNPKVSVSWVRQIRASEEETYNYYCSYGVQIDGTVKVYTAADLETEEGKAALINLFDKYYPTLASAWGSYSAGFAAAQSEEEVTAAKLNYITTSMNRGTMVTYEIIPDQIVITAPFLMNMVPQMANGLRFTTQAEGENKYAYGLELSDAFLDRLVAYKAAAIATEEGKAAVEAYYASPMFQMLDSVAAQYNMPTSLQAALMENNACGLKTQTTYIPQ